MARRSKWILASLVLPFLGTAAREASSWPLRAAAFATGDPAIYDLPSRTPLGYQSTLPGAALHASIVAGRDAMTHSPHGIRYANGKFLFSTADIESAGQSGFGHTRSWSSSGASYEGVNGCEGFASHQLPGLFQDPVSTSKITLYMGADPTRSFEKSGNNYTPHHFYQESLTYNSGGTELIYKTTAGERWIFHDWSHGTAALRGKLKTHYDSYGNQTTVTRNGSHLITDVQKSLGSTTEKWLYTYISGTGDPARDGLFQDVTLQYGLSGSFTTVRKAVYDYYTNATFDGNGATGNVRTVKIQDGSSTTLSTKYYRYNENTTGFFLPLRFVVEGRAYERLKDAAGGTDALVFTAADSLVDDYAQFYMTYDAFKQVATQTVLGAGCDCGSNGTKGKFTYVYTATTVSGYTDDPNKWKTETIEVFKDLNDVELYRNTIYTNYLGQVMLKVFKDNDTDNEWRTYFQYDSASRLILQATPSAVTGHDNTTVGLVSGTHLKDSDGLIYTWEYGTSTTATTTTPGNVAGYLKNHKLKKGETDANPDTQGLMEYLSHADGNSITIYPVGKNTVYRSADAGGAIATSFTYTWHANGSDTNAIKSKTTTFPTVTTAQNGPNSGDVLVGHFDKYGKPTWTKDEDGFIHYREYDTETGAMTKSIVDVDTDITGDFTGLPSGWSNPSGIHLKTDFRVDDLGRTTKITDPKGNITYIVFKDVDKEIRTYPGWDTGTSKPTGPTRMAREDWTRSYDEQVAFSATPALTGSEPNGTESIGSTIQRMTRTKLDNGDRPTEVRDYFSPGGLTHTTTYSLGTLDTHYYQTTYGYDHFGMQNRVLDGAGTITRTVRDTRRRPISTWIGTDDTPTSGFWSPTNNAGANMLKTSESQYDHNATPVAGVGNDTLTQVKSFGDDSTFYTTENRYDWRDRLEISRGADNVGTKRTYDNLSQVTIEETFADTDTDLVLDSGELRDKTESSFDEEGKLYQSANFEVASGMAGDKLPTNHWYDKRGNLIKSKNPNSLLSKRKTDGAGRLVATYTSEHDAETAYGDADDVTSDKVIEQNKSIYDKASNVVTQTNFKRADNDTTTTGELVWDSSVLPEVYIQVVVGWFDKANRITHSVNYGRDNRSTRYVYNTNGTLIDTSPANGIPDVAEGAAPEPPGPTNDHYRITKATYNSAGQSYRTIDNLNRIHETTFDAEDRVLATVKNYVDGSVSATEFDQDRKTEYLRIAGGRLEKLRAHNAKGSTVEQQDTKYLYESAINKSWATNIIYPDSSDTGSSGTDQVKLAFDRLGRTLTRKDPRGSERTFTFDSAGRALADKVTTLGTGVDGTVQRIENAYDDLSRRHKVTSYSAATGGTVVDEVKFSFNDWRLPSKIEQANTGAVGGGTPAIDLNYTDGASAGIAKFVRLTSVVYPGPATRRTVYFNFPAAATLGDRLDRLDNIAEDSSGTNKFAQYNYLGHGMFIKITYGGVTGGLNLSYRTGGNYAAFNSFGEIVEQNWLNTDGTTSFSKYLHAYNRLGTRTNRDVVPSVAPPTAKDEYYELDNLERLKKMNRGSLSSGTISDANANFMHHWSEMESAGNWKSFIEDTNGGGAGGSTTQARTHTKANEVSTVSGNSPDWIDPAYDAAGNMTSGPKGDAESTKIHFTFDAWNRLVEVKNDSGGSPGTSIATYRYNGLGQRVRKTVVGSPNVTFDYYYNLNWQVLEIRRTPNGSATRLYEQYVWDAGYIDAVDVRYRNADLSTDDSVEEKLYYLQDANFNTTVLMNSSGTILERYTYDPYGKVYMYAGDSSWTTRSSSSYSNEILYAGYRVDTEMGTYQVRNREYHPKLGGWMQRDPQEYHDGSNLYAYGRTNPVLYSDSHGLFASGQGMAGYWINQGIQASNAAVIAMGNRGGSVTYSWGGGAGAASSFNVSQEDRFPGVIRREQERAERRQGSPSDPRPRTPDWGGPLTDTSKGNCYRYATSSPIDPSNLAARLSRHQLDPSGVALPFTCPMIINGAKTDGARDTIRTTDNKITCPEYHYLIYAVVAPPQPGHRDPFARAGDHHWYRRDPGGDQTSVGSWSSKIGSTRVRTTDGSGNRIVEPASIFTDHDYSREADPGLNYSQGCGYLCWPYNRRLP